MTNAEAWFNKSLRPRKPEGSLGQTAQDVHLDSHTAPELWLPYLYYWLLLYSAILRSQADSLHLHVILHEWIAFYSTFFFLTSTEVVYLQRWHGWCHKKLLPSRHALCTPYNHALCHFMHSHIHKVYACLAVTCHPRFWQSDWGLLRATAVTQGWNGHRNKSQHRKLTLGKKILLLLQQGFKPTTFQSRVRCSNHWDSPTPHARNDSTYETRVCHRKRTISSF